MGNSKSYDVIVIGLGAIGSACIYHLVKGGARVLGIERFDLANDQASSGGYARQIKMAPYVGTRDEPLIRRAYQLWHELSADTGLPVIEQTGWIGVHPQSFWSGRTIGLDSATSSMLDHRMGGTVGAFPSND